MTQFHKEIDNFVEKYDIDIGSVFSDASYYDPDLVQHIIDHEDFKNLDKTELEEALRIHKAKKTKITQEELDKVFSMLNGNRLFLRPNGKYDKQKRFYLYDSELVNVRPTVADPFLQIYAARTPKFIKALAEKYRVQSLKELLHLFNDNF